MNYIFGSCAEKVVPFKTNQPEKKKGNYKVGEKQEVYPFKKQEDLKAMYNYFTKNGQFRNRLMFVVGINVGLRAGDLLSLKWDMVLDDDNSVVDELTVKEEKTEKFRTFYFNSSCKKALSEYFAEYRPERNSYIFQSSKCKEESLNVRSAGKILKTAAKDCGIKYNVGTHSMRKTFGYHQLINHRNDALFLCQLQKMFGHSTPEITLRYCGLENEQLQQYYNDVNLL